MEKQELKYKMMHLLVQVMIIVFKEQKHKLIFVKMQHVLKLLNNLQYMLDKIFMLDKKLNNQVLNSGK